MPVSGRTPKAEHLTRHRNKPVHDWVDVLDVPFRGAPKLPSTMPDGSTWPRATRAWWARFSTMPHCKLWAPSDWEFAFDTAFLKALFHMKATASVATEIRNRERVLGTTVDFRRSLRIRYVAEQPVEHPAEVSHLDDYRDL